MDIFMCYLCVINVAAFILYGADKYKAKKRLWRVPEKVLLLFAAAGGSIGALLGMFVFHHKTKHLKFVIGVPVILAVQLWIAGVLFLK